MNKVLFLVSHLGSGSDQLIEILNSNDRISIYDTNMYYDTPEALNFLFMRNHKLKNTAAIYGDHVLFNHSISTSKLFDFCKFIYFINDAKTSINNIVKNDGYSPDAALRYYCFRLRRMCEMLLKNKNSIFINYDWLKNTDNFEIIENYLGLKSKINKVNLIEPEPLDIVPYSIIESGQECYERYLFYFNKLAKNCF